MKSDSSAYLLEERHASGDFGLAASFWSKIGCEKIMSTMGSSECPAASTARRPPSGRPQASPTRAVPVRLLPRLLVSAGAPYLCSRRYLTTASVRSFSAEGVNRQTLPAQYRTVDRIVGNTDHQKLKGLIP